MTSTSDGVFLVMQLPLTPPVVAAALLVSVAVTPQVGPVIPAPRPPVDRVDTSQETADVPGSSGSSFPPLVVGGSCPAYVGPQCDSPAHEQWADGQLMAALAHPVG